MVHRYHTSARNYERMERMYTESAVSYADFLFYNKQKQIIPRDIIDGFKRVLEDNPKEVIFWTNERFLSARLYFKFYMWQDANGKTKEVNIKIGSLEKSDLTVEDICSCKVIVNNCWLLQFMPTEDQYVFLKETSTEFATLIPKVYSTWEQLVEKLIVDKHLDNDIIDNFEETKDVVSLLFNEQIKEQQYEIISENSRFNSKRIYHIVKVVEKRFNNKNYRIAFCRFLDRWEKHYYMYVIPEENYRYLYIDEDRIFFSMQIRDRSYKDYFLDNGLTQRRGTTVKVNIDLIEMFMRNAEVVLGNDRCVITAQIYRFYSERFTMIDNKGVLDDNDVLILAKYKQVLTEGREVKMSHLMLTQTKIQVKDQPFILQFNKNFYDVIKHLPTLHRFVNSGDDVRYNFNELYESIIKASKLYVIRMDNTKHTDYINFTRTTFVLNGMKITVHKENNRIYINDIFCRIDDIFQVLNRAVCYTSLADYERYIKDVSYIGHEWKRLIGTGILIELENPFVDIMRRLGEKPLERTHMRFSLMWDPKRRTRLYVYANGQKYLIKQKQKFKQRFNVPRLNITMRKLKEYLTLCLEDVTDDVVLDIVENAVAEGEIIRKKGEALVKHTVSDINAVEQDLQISGSRKKGYTFTGRVSGSEYFVDMTDLSVYKKVDGAWNRRCVVNDNSKNRIFEDWLANRLVNVYNEPTFIHTLHNV